MDYELYIQGVLLFCAQSSWASGTTITLTRIEHLLKINKWMKDWDNYLSGEICVKFMLDVWNTNQSNNSFVIWCQKKYQIAALMYVFS